MLYIIYNMKTIAIHPIANLFINDFWFQDYLYENKKCLPRKRKSFYKYYFRHSLDRALKRKNDTENKEFFFRCLLEDGFSSEQIVKIRFETKQREKRLKLKLKELNLEPWDISTTSSSFHLTAKHNNIEIFNEKFYIRNFFLPK